MTKIAPITATETRFPLGGLYLSPLNPRQDVPESDVIDLAASIWEAGMIQSIGGLVDDEGKCGIVAGGRRLRALQYLAERHPDMATLRPELANPLVMLAPDLETARLWATVENIARRDLHPAEEIRAYGKMAAAGSSPATIASAFAVTEKHVYRRLALARLPAPVLDALAANEISLSMASAFTICNDHDLALTVLDQCRGEAWNDYRLKAALRPSNIKGSDRRAVFVGVDAYKDAGGSVVGDLFADVTYIEDEALLDRLFREKLELGVASTLGLGWKWVEANADFTEFGWNERKSTAVEQITRVRGELSEDQAARYDELTELAEAEALDEEEQTELDAMNDVIDGTFTAQQKAVSGVVLYVNYNGEIRAAEGLIRPSDVAEARAAGVIKGGVIEKEPGQTKSPISNALADDLRRVVTGARQHAALRDPQLILALLAYQLTGEMDYSSAFGLRVEDVPNLPTTGAEGYALDERLTTEENKKGRSVGGDMVKGFRAFRKKGSEQVMAELVRHLASLLRGGGVEMKALIDKEVKINVREVWTPVAANFWARVPGSYRVRVWCELLDLNEDHPSATVFGKMKKAEQTDKLEALFTDPAFRAALGVTGKQADRIANWLPEGMA
jgi:ParB family chromosome partitioning protein